MYFFANIFSKRNFQSCIRVLVHITKIIVAPGAFKAYQ